MELFSIHNYVRQVCAAKQHIEVCCGLKNKDYFSRDISFQNALTQNLA